MKNHAKSISPRGQNEVESCWKIFKNAKGWSFPNFSCLPLHRGQLDQNAWLQPWASVCPKTTSAHTPRLNLRFDFLWFLMAHFKSRHGAVCSLLCAANVTGSLLVVSIKWRLCNKIVQGSFRYFLCESIEVPVLCQHAHTSLTIRYNNAKSHVFMHASADSKHAWDLQSSTRARSPKTFVWSRFLSIPALTLVSVFKWCRPGSGNEAQTSRLVSIWFKIFWSGMCHQLQKIQGIQNSRNSDLRTA